MNVLDQVIDDTILTRRVKCKRPKFEYFDKDGFDLTEFEALCYEQHGYPLERKANRVASQKIWIANIDNDNVDIHHSYMCIRLAFADELAEQVSELAHKYKMPQLLRLLQIKPKFGLDINLEYTLSDGTILDLFHYEEDFPAVNNNTTEARICEIEYLVKNTDWDEIARQLVEKRDEWSQMTGDDENDYKARLVGLERAYRTYKVL